MLVKAHLVYKRILELVLRIHLIVYRIIVEVEIILRAGRLFRNSREPWHQRAHPHILLGIWGVFLLILLLLLDLIGIIYFIHSLIQLLLECILLNSDLIKINDLIFLVELTESTQFTYFSCATRLQALLSDSIKFYLMFLNLVGWLGPTRARLISADLPVYIYARWASRHVGHALIIWNPCLGNGAPRPFLLVWCLAFKLLQLLIFNLALWGRPSNPGVAYLKLLKSWIVVRACFSPFLSLLWLGLLEAIFLLSSRCSLALIWFRKVKELNATCTAYFALPGVEEAPINRVIRKQLL